MIKVQRNSEAKDFDGGANERPTYYDSLRILRIIVPDHNSSIETPSQFFAGFAVPILLSLLALAGVYFLLVHSA